jgi:DNA repair photolyase
LIAISEVKIARILNPTSIDLGDYVINPYKGCEFSCLYCYVRSNRTTSRETRPWGSYVDVRFNAPERLEKEIALRKPQCVLLGSTTECFQPVEKRYGISRQILEILNRQSVSYVILTRSPLIAEYTPLLREGFCKKIYFTVNNFPLALKAQLEPKSPGFELRFEAINKLLDAGVSVTPYFSPILPWITDMGRAFEKFPKAEGVEGEGLNFNLINIADVIAAIGQVYPELKDNYKRLVADKEFFDMTWRGIRKEFVSQAAQAKKSYNIYIHQFGDYFKNKYQ